MRELARHVTSEGRVYLTGGACAVLLGWQMLSSGLVQPVKLRELFDAIEPELYRYPAIGPQRFRRAVESTLGHIQ